MAQALNRSRETQKLLSYERALWASGYQLIAGIDEVGRGALAGPLVAAAVIFPSEVSSKAARRRDAHEIRDSKTLTPEKRARLFPIICDLAMSVAVGVVEAFELDEVGVAAANRLAMERAVDKLPICASMLLLDAMTIDNDVPQIGIIDGDARSLSIAAASIVAKVTRDRIMDEYHCVDGRYGFLAHKGYGTPKHLSAIRQYGACWCHRRSFRPCSLEIPLY
ncbi:MAG: ribonuclease HII [Thermomicrobiales bacterium]